MDREKWHVERCKRFNPKVLSKTFQDKGWQLFYDVSLLESKPLRPYYESSIPSRIRIWIFHRLFCKSNNNCPLWINMAQEKYPTIKPFHFKIKRKILIIWNILRKNTFPPFFLPSSPTFLHFFPSLGGGGSMENIYPWNNY